MFENHEMSEYPESSDLLVRALQRLLSRAGARIQHRLYDHEVMLQRSTLGRSMEHMRQILRGISGIWDALQPRPYPAYRGFRADAQALREDVATIGAGLNTVSRKALAEVKIRRSKELKRTRGHGKANSR